MSIVCLKENLSRKLVQLVCKFQHIKDVSQFEICPDGCVEEFGTLKSKKTVLLRLLKGYLILYLMHQLCSLLRSCHATVVTQRSREGALCEEPKRQLRRRLPAFLICEILVADFHSLATK